MSAAQRWPGPGAGEARAPGAATPRPGGYRAPWWLPGGHAQTIYAALFAPVARAAGAARALGHARRRLRGRRLRRRSGRGAARRALPRARRRLLDRHYARALMPPRRGAAGGGACRTFAAAAASRTACRAPTIPATRDEIDWVLRRLALAAGGAAVRGRRLARRQRAAQVARRARRRRRARWCRAAAAVSAPLDLIAAGEALGRGFNMVYTRNFLATLRRKARGEARALPRPLRRPRACARARTLARLRRRRHRAAARVSRRRRLLDARERASRGSRTSACRRWSSTRATIRSSRRRRCRARTRCPPQVTLEFPPTGGHVGFVHGPFPGRSDWLPRRIASFFDETTG